MAHKDRIPETKTVKPNRAQRRHPEQDQDEPLSRSTELQDGMLDQGAAADDVSVRAKSTGHGKKTADKWNQ